MKERLSERGFYVFLIPVFFVLHGYNENFGLIGFGDVLLLLITYLAGAAIVYFFGWIIYRNHLKTALFSGTLLFFYFFFGAIDDFFKEHLPLLSRYQYILPIFFAALCGFSIYLEKTGHKLNKTTLLINCLLIIYLLVDIGAFLWKSLHPNEDKLSIYGIEKKYAYTPCRECNDPDIYFLLFDEFSSTENLKQNFHYDNSELDSFLLKRGFSIQTRSNSNYNFTFFSIASILNLNYINGIKNAHRITSQDYTRCTDLIRNNEVIRFLSSRKYDIVNYSMFDLAGSPTLLKSGFFPTKTRLITDQTLFNRIMRDLGWNLYMGRFEIHWLTRNNLYENLNNNNKILDLLNKETRHKSNSPRFVYAHFLMPHPPFYYDRNGQLRDKKILDEEIPQEQIKSYVGYIPYTTGKLKAMVDTIQKNSNNKAVIILMGDHGYRFNSSTLPISHNFKNLNAVYFPDKTDSLLTDSVSGVNQFREIFNIMFKQNMPLLEDSTIFLKERYRD